MRNAARTALLCASLVGAPVGAQPPEPTEAGPAPSGLKSDVKAYLTAPLHADRQRWVRFGIVAGAIAAAYAVDDDVRNRFDTTVAPPGQKPDTRDAEHALPAALVLGGTWAAAALLDDDDRRREARAMLKAAAFSGAATLLMKEVAGRSRPYETVDESDWRDGGDSFPSMHTSVAFAIGTVLAESGDDRRRRLRRVLGYGIAAWTAYARMDEDAHWLSDTVAGAALGIATARFVLQRSERDRRGALRLAPTPDGVRLGYTVALRQ